MSNENLTVELVDSMGSDASVIDAMLVSTGKDRDPDAYQVSAVQGRIEFLMRNRHASPFEHVSATFRVRCPIFVAREWMRHRTQSFNETSGRYRQLEDAFYEFDSSRPISQVGKPGAYTFEANEGLASEARWKMVNHYHASRVLYEELLASGVAKEVARNVLPVAQVTEFYATSNLRNWLNFLSLRTHQDAQWEIRQLANSIEEQLRPVAPITMAMWVNHGRTSL